MDVVILAAGMGTRMKSTLPKLLHRILDKPIIDYVIDCAQSLNPFSIFVVVNPSLNKVIEHLSMRNVKIIFQNEPKGTANAVEVALPYIKSEKILILNGDTPLIKKDTLFKFLRLFDEKAQDLAILSFFPDRQHSYGRILRNSKGEIEKIVEITDYSGSESGEANSGIYMAKKEVLELVKEIKENPRKGEFYLTDLVEIAITKGYKVDAYAMAEEDELIGINNREELSLAMKYLRDRVVKELMSQGVTFYEPDSVWISPSVKIGQDTIVYPNVFLEGNTVIGNNCIIYQGVRIRDSVIEEMVQVKDCTVIEGSYIKSGSKIGPFAHIRPESFIGKECRIGNFVEVKKSVIGDGTKAAHLSYLGDAEIGKNVNIGAGTITCNYDGKKKHKTTIEDEVFIGSDTQLVAPVKVAKGAYIAAGSTITKDVPEDSLAISRTPQKHIKGWAKKKREKQ
ncbi:bifunctional UDP-N-acetylglucosamine diphosphorylase/glucosamine-1-phosphate N-acetyltransferase GlmU [Thermodesulfovibrio sp. TK110]